MRIKRSPEGFFYYTEYEGGMEREYCEICKTMLSEGYSLLREKLPYIDAPKLCCHCYKLWRRSTHSKLQIFVKNGLISVAVNGDVTTFLSDLPDMPKVEMTWKEIAKFLRKFAV